MDDRNPIEMLKELAANEKPMTEKETIIDIYFNLFWNISNVIKDKCFLKGNVLLNKLYKDRARSTLDLDMGLISKELYDSVVSVELAKFGSDLVSRGIASTYEVRDIRSTRNGGIDVRDENGIKLYSVDVALDDTTFMGIVSYSFDGKYILGSSTERILCDKCLSTLSNRKFKRIKDFYDLYIILISDTKYDEDIVYKLMCDIKGKESVDSLIKTLPFSIQTLSSLRNIWNVYDLQSVSSDFIQKVDFGLIYSTINILYDKLKFRVGD